VPVVDGIERSRIQDTGHGQAPEALANATTVLP